MQRWAKWFAERGHEVHLISPDDENIEGVKIHLIGKKKEGSVTNFIIKMFQTRKLVRKIKPDILHAHYAFGHGTFAAFANYHPFVVSVWGGDVLIYPNKNIIFSGMVKYVIKKADYVTVFSEYLEKEVKKFLKDGKKVDVVIPWESRWYEKVDSNLVEKYRRELDIPEEALVVLSPRNMMPIYRIENIVYSIPRVIKEYPNTIFVFLKGMADKKYFHKIKDIIKKLSIGKNVRIIEKWLDEREMVALYALSEISISIPKLDQFSGAVRESMLIGTVPIVSSLPIYTSNLKNGKNVLFVSGDNSEEIANMILRAIKNDSLREKIKQNNKKFIYEYEKKFKKLEDMETIYKNLVGK